MHVGSGAGGTFQAQGGQSRGEILGAKKMLTLQGHSSAKGVFNLPY